MITRRKLLVAGSAALAGCAGSSPTTTEPKANQPEKPAKPGKAAAATSKSLAAIHKRIGGRLGVHALDAQTGQRLGYDDDSRYAMASTFKLPLAAALLWQVDRRAFNLERTLAITQKDLLPNSPAVTEKFSQNAQGMTIRELCAAAVTQSDNSAANLLLAGIGGPNGFNNFMRSLGDATTRLDRMEPDLNSNLPGDVRDTTTPRAMVDVLARIFTGEGFSLTSRALLIDWLSAAATGLDRVRAGLPKNWNPGDKTGTGNNGAYNDLVVAWPPERKPVYIAVYMSESKLAPEALKAAHAEIGALVAREFNAA